jgi:hypothetical protein
MPDAPKTPAIIFASFIPKLGRKEASAFVAGSSVDFNSSRSHWWKLISFIITLENPDIFDT